MATLLFEIGTEEMPAQYMPGILADYKALAETKLKELRIPFKALRVVGTPRRMAFLAEEVAANQADTTVESKGPSLKIAFTADGTPSKAAQGFARGQGVEVSALEKRDGYVYAVKHLQGQPVEKLLPAMLDDILHSLSFPKTMRWANYEFGFVRPIRWLVAMLDNKVIPVEVNDVKSSNKTIGHRFLSKGMVEIPTADDYEKVLADHFVIVDQTKRRTLIRQQVEAVAKAEGGVAAIEPGLLEEVLYLVEYPTALCGHIDEKYLTLPKEAVITPMRDHQRYFPVLSEEGKLLPKFITVRNGGKEHLEVVTHGNERVLRARLDDAVFFFTLDRKESLAKHRDKLKKVAFQQGLGNMYDKTERLKLLAEKLQKAAEVKLDVKALGRAALLCKADLVTGMVTEFTELQGIMGREYALLDGESPVVAMAISEHYQPRFAGDELPRSEEGRILGISDKLDNIVATFSRGLAPTGSQDPYALRRQALGVINIALAGNYHFSLNKVMAEALELLKVPAAQIKNLLPEVQEFFWQRAKNMLLESGIRYDVVDAVLADKAADDLTDIFTRAKALEAYVTTPVAQVSIQAFTRVDNICKNQKIIMQVEPSLFVAPEEKVLFAAAETVEKEIAPAVAGYDYTKVLAAADKLAAPVNKFFDAVMVMDKDEKVKNNRLALLGKVKALVNKVGTLSALVMAKKA